MVDFPLVQWTAQTEMQRSKIVFTVAILLVTSSKTFLHKNKVEFTKNGNFIVLTAIKLPTYSEGLIFFFVRV